MDTACGSKSYAVNSEPTSSLSHSWTFVLEVIPTIKTRFLVNILGEKNHCLLDSSNEGTSYLFFISRVLSETYSFKADSKQQCYENTGYFNVVIQFSTSNFCTEKLYPMVRLTVNILFFFLLILH